MRKTTITCDICKNATDVTERSIQIRFLSEQNEGRAITPYLNEVKMDICNECLDRLVRDHPLEGWGAMGYNTYRFSPSGGK